MAKTVILQVLAFLAAMHLSSAMAPFKRPSMLPAMIPRGGAGSLDPTVLAKVLGGACLIQGAQFALAPKINDCYGGVDVTNECNAKIVRRSGLSILNIGVHIYCLLFKGYDMKVSTTINTLMWMADTMSSLLNNESESIGPSKAGDVSILAFSSMVAYSALNDSPWYGTALKAQAVFFLATTLSCVVSPAFGVKIWELKGDDELTPGSVSCIGCNVGMLGTLSAALAWDVEPLTAIGYACVVGAILDVNAFFFTPEVDKLGFNKALLGIWPFFAAVTAARILM